MFLVVKVIISFGNDGILYPLLLLSDNHADTLVLSRVFETLSPGFLTSVRVLPITRPNSL